MSPEPYSILVVPVEALLVVGALLSALGFSIQLGVAESLERRGLEAAGLVAKAGVVLAAGGTLLILLAAAPAAALTISTPLDEYRPVLEDWYNTSLPPLAYPGEEIVIVSRLTGNYSNVSAEAYALGAKLRILEERIEEVPGGYRYTARAKLSTKLYEWSDLLSNNYKPVRVFVAWYDNDTLVHRDWGRIWLIEPNVTIVMVRVAAVNFLDGNMSCDTDANVTVEVYNPALGYPPPGDPYWGDALPPLPGQLEAELYLCVDAWFPASNHSFPGICYADPVVLGADEDGNYTVRFYGDPRWGRIAYVEYEIVSPNAPNGTIEVLNSSIAAPLAPLEVVDAPQWPVSVADSNSTHILEAPGIACVEPGPVQAGCQGCAEWVGVVSDYTVIEVEEAARALPAPGTPETGVPRPWFTVAVSAALALALFGIWLVLGKPGVEW